MDVCHDSRRRDDEGRTDQAFDPVLCNAPLKNDQPNAKTLFDEWHSTVAYMSSHLSPKSLDLSVVCDVHHGDMEAARHAVDPIWLFPELRNCHTRLSRTSTLQLRRMAHDAVLGALRITGPSSSGNVAGVARSTQLEDTRQSQLRDASRLLSLPRELRSHILTYRYHHALEANRVESVPAGQWALRCFEIRVWAFTRGSHAVRFEDTPWLPACQLLGSRLLLSLRFHHRMLLPAAALDLLDDVHGVHVLGAPDSLISGELPGAFLFSFMPAFVLQHVSRRLHSTFIRLAPERRLYAEVSFSTPLRQTFPPFFRDLTLHTTAGQSHSVSGCTSRILLQQPLCRTRFPNLLALEHT